MWSSRDGKRTFRRFVRAAGIAAAVFAAISLFAATPPVAAGTGWGIPSPSPPGAGNDHAAGKSAAMLHGDVGAPRAFSVPAPPGASSASSRGSRPMEARNGRAETVRLVLLDLGMAGLCTLVFGALVLSPARSRYRGRRAAGREENPGGPPGESRTTET